MGGVNFRIGRTRSAVKSDGSFFDDFASLNTSDWEVYDRLGDQSNSEDHSYKPSQLTVSNSILTITAKKENYTVGDYYRAPALRNYISGALKWKTYNFTYGTVEVRARINCATARGAWAAIWFLGYKGQDTHHLTADDVDDFVWPGADGSGEIDFVENKGGNDVANKNYFNCYEGANSSVQTSTADTMTDWHTYKMVWSAGSLVFYVDDVQRSSITQSWVPDTAMFIIINIAMGGGAGAITDADFPATMEVDWVRVTPA